MGKGVKRAIIIIVVVTVLILGIMKIMEASKEKDAEQNEILSHYGELVKTTKNAKIYTYSENSYNEAGIISSGEIINLEKIDYNSDKFKIPIYEIFRTDTIEKFKDYIG